MTRILRHLARTVTERGQRPTETTGADPRSETESDKDVHDCYEHLEVTDTVSGKLIYLNIKYVYF